MIRTVLLNALALAVLLVPLTAKAKDAEVAQRLAQIGMQYTVDKDGDYKVTIRFAKEHRTQMVFVSGATETLGGMTIRKIFAPAATIVTDGIDGAKALELLRDSRTKKLGSWEIEGANLLSRGESTGHAHVRATRKGHDGNSLAG